MTDLVDELAAAREEYRDARERVEAVGEHRLKALADAHRRATRLLDRYEADATGTGDFGAYVEFQERLVELVEGLPDDLPERSAFERAKEILDRRRLRERDFERARGALGSAASRTELLDERDDARGRYRDARRAVRERKRQLDERIEELERLLELGRADLDAPVERLREPIEAYNEAVRDAFEAFRRAASAREFLDFVASTDRYPLVDFRRVPADLREYVETHEAGREPVPRLLEYAEYSPSKLAHYVEDPGALKRAVATRRTYLERLDADPLAVAWPPPPADRLRWQARERVAVVGRFAPDEVVARLREVRTLARDPDYGRLREAAIARAELGPGERDRVESGGVEADLEAAREERERLAAALDAHPEP